MIPFANIAFSVICLGAGAGLWLSRLWPKLQIVLMLIAGAGVTSGVVGGTIRDGVQAAMDWISGSTQWAFGAPVPGLLAMVTLLIVVTGWKGKTGWMRQWSRHVVPMTALISPIAWYLTGGIFQALALIIGGIGGALGWAFFNSMGLG